MCIRDRYKGDKYIKSYTCWNQLLTMMFGQLSNRESLREMCIRDSSITETQELVVPKSIPIIFPIVIIFLIVYILDFNFYRLSDRSIDLSVPVKR